MLRNPKKTKQPLSGDQQTQLPTNGKAKEVLKEKQNVMNDSSDFTFTDREQEMTEVENLRTKKEPV